MRGGWERRSIATMASAGPAFWRTLSLKATYTRSPFALTAMPRGRPGTGISAIGRRVASSITVMVRASSLLTNTRRDCCGTALARNTSQRAVYVNTYCSRRERAKDGVYGSIFYTVDGIYGAHVRLPILGVLYVRPHLQPC